jgi:hypothetical protein
MDITKKDLIKKLEAFSTAAVELLQAWQQLQFPSIMDDAAEEKGALDDILTQNCRHQEAFEEIVNDICRRCEKTIEQIQTLP